MPRTIAYTEELIVEVCWCGIHHAIPAALARHAREDGKGVYCPLGHVWVVRETDVTKLEKQLAARTAQLDQARARVSDIERSNSALRGQVTKAKNEADRLKQRAAAGVCPCCHRSFQNVRRHMDNQHPDYATDA